LFTQVSKISALCLFLGVGLFQQVAVGGNDLRAVQDTLPTVNDSDTAIVTSDSLRTPDDTLVSSEGLSLPVKYHARDSIRVDVEQEAVYLYGAATVDYDDLHLEAERIRINMGAKEVFAEGVTDSLGNTIGMPHFSQGPQEFRSRAMRYNFQTKKGKIDYVITKEGDGYIHGDIVKKDPENNFFIRNGRYTTCDLDTPHFSISANKLKVISNNKIVTGPAYLSIEQVPTPLFIPFGFFPNKKGRSSGIIFPGIGESAQRGFFFQHLGYYFGFNDFFNLALTTDLYTKGSYTIDGISQYRKRYRYGGSFRISYAYSVQSEKELPDFNARKDFQITWTHNQDPKANPYSIFNASVHAGSSAYYQNTIASTNNFLANTFQSSLTWTKLFPDQPFNLNVAVNHAQNNLTRDVRITAPDVSFNVARIFPFQRKMQIGRQRWYEKIGFTYNLRGTNYLERKDSLLFRRESLDELRNGIQHQIPLSTAFNVLKFINVSPNFNYTERWYFRTTEYAYNAERGALDTLRINRFRAAREYSAGITAQTRIYGMFQFARGPVAAFRHVITPSAGFSYRPDFSQERYGYFKTVQADTTGRTLTYSVFQNSVFGSPSGGKFGSMNFGLDNNFEMKVRTYSDTGMTLKKIKLLESLRLGASYNLIADSMKWSPLSISGRTTILDRAQITFNGTLNPYAYDENNRYYDHYLRDVTGQLLQLTNAAAAVNFSLLAKRKDKSSSKLSHDELEYINRHPEEYIDFEVPYNLYVGYNYGYSKFGNAPSNTSQAVSLSGDLSMTPRWKVGFNSWYDIEVGRFTNFNLNINRDLHCWEFRFNWVPFGFQESFFFQINVKSSVLQDLKLMKQRTLFDR
jgi:lipopolysaccharide assembly outer membrane protein LptD (OstA)